MKELGNMCGGYCQINEASIPVVEDDIIDEMLTLISLSEKECGGAEKRNEKILGLVKIDFVHTKQLDTLEDFEDFYFGTVEPFLENCDDDYTARILEINDKVEDKMNKLECGIFSNKYVSPEFGNYVETNLSIILDEPETRYVYLYYKKDQNSDFIECLEQVIYVGRGTDTTYAGHLLNLYNKSNAINAILKNTIMGDLAVKGKHSKLYIKKVKINCSDDYFQYLENSIISLYGVENTTKEERGDLTPFTEHSFAYGALQKCFTSKDAEEWQVCLFECSKCESDEKHKYQRKNVGYTIEIRCKFDSN